MIFLPLSADFSTYVAFVAPLIAFPDRYHRYVNLTLEGAHFPAFAVSFLPTLTEPVIFGVTAFNVPAAITTAGEATTDDVYPALAPVTRTLTNPPRSAGCTTYVAAPAPAIGTPLRNHSNETATGAGPHEPGDAVNVEPTVAEPATVATPAVTTGVTGVPGVTTTGAFTDTLSEAETEPDSTDVAVIVATPAPVAVTNPADDTLATAEFELDHTTPDTAPAGNTDACNTTDSPTDNSGTEPGTIDTEAGETFLTVIVYVENAV